MATAAIETRDHYFFNSGPLGLDWLCSFEDQDGKKYNSLNQYYYYQKALFFGDKVTAEKIFSSHDVREQRRLARYINPISEARWEERHTDILQKGCLLKFTQNKDLASFLKAKSSRPLIYCSRRQPALGIDIDISEQKNAYIQSRYKNKSGQNTLGATLGQVAEMLSTEMANIPIIMSVDKRSDIYPYIAGDIHFVVDVDKGVFTSLNRIVEAKQKIHGPTYTIHTLLSTFTRTYHNEEAEEIIVPLDDGTDTVLTIDRIPSMYIRSLGALGNRNVHAFLASETLVARAKSKEGLRKEFYYYVSNVKATEVLKVEPIVAPTPKKEATNKKEGDDKKVVTSDDFNQSAQKRRERYAQRKRQRNKPLPPEPHVETAHEAKMRERREEHDRSKKQRLRERLRS